MPRLIETEAQSYAGFTKGITKTRNRKRNETENEMKVSKENKYMNFVDTTAYKEKTILNETNFWF